MAEEKKEEKAKSQPAKEAKQQEPVPAPAKESPKHRHIKISRMNLAQVEKALEDTKKHMGGLISHYGRTLLARKAFLSNLKSTPR